jgi:large subunit ribosomal protein L20
MPRVKRGMHHVKRRKNILARTKGMMWGRKSKLTLAQIAGIKAGVHAYRDRKKKKRDFRALWNIRIGAFVRPLGLSYSRFIYLLKQKKVDLDRKILADLAVNNKKVLKKVVESVKK